MLFNSFAFAVFLPLVFALHWALPHRWRWALLLVASYYFYMSWDARYIVLILFTTVVSWAAALVLGSVQAKAGGVAGDVEARRAKRRVVVAATLVACLGVLFFFKYYNWLAGDLVALLNSLAIPLEPTTLNIMLPVGISFYTFQTLSYVIDVYRGDLPPERHFGYYATYVAFFPQLVAGPIERADNILPQLRAQRSFNRVQATLGAQRMAWGFFKKICVADLMAKGVNVVYGDVTSFTGAVLIVATVMFAIQIYCDFSGYSDIAIGCALLFGVKLMDNFDSPYYSASIKEFWSRWHISLSTWFRDYVYIPLGGNRCSAARHDFNLMATFLVSGLWYGANWTFLIWGGVHGLGQIVENHIRRRFPGFGKQRGWKRALVVIVTFAFVCAAWVFFRADSVQEAVYIFGHAFDGVSHPRAYLLTLVGFWDASWQGVAIVAFELAVLAAVDWLRMSRPLNEFLLELPAPARYALYVVALCAIAFLSVKGTATEFIYFQF